MSDLKQVNLRRTGDPGDTKTAKSTNRFAKGMRGGKGEEADVSCVHIGHLLHYTHTYTHTHIHTHTQHV